MTGWRPALRLAWRDAWKARGRSILVLVMIALPVLAVTAAAIVQATADVDGAEAVPRTMGAAEARIVPLSGTVLQTPDPVTGTFTTRDGGEPPTLDAVTAVLGDRPVTTIRGGHADVAVGDRRVDTVATEVDLRDPLAEGLFELRTGELPAAPGEAVVNEALAERGLVVGDTVAALGQQVTVVGIGRDATWRDTPTITALPGALGPDFSGGSDDLDGDGTEWLVGGGDVTWSEVRELNAIGALVISRAVIEDPPPLPPDVAELLGSGVDSSDYVAIVSLIIAMALLEVVLLAGPAFAVGARRQARTLALMAACGGTPRQARRVVLASGIVLGAVAALVGAVLGVVVGAALLPLVQQFSGAWFGPFDVRWWLVAVVAAFGLLSAFLAAVVPAWLASQQDVVAVLAGRRGDPPPSARTPVVGVALLGVGIALSVVGVKGGEAAIALGAVVAVLGMIFIVPLVVSVLARWSARLPLVMRYAARDAARHRTRTVPAVAAVAATVAGVVALGIANSSDEAENRETYQPSLAMGAGTVSIYPGFDENNGQSLPVPESSWAQVQAAVRERVPDADPEVLVGQTMEDEEGSYYLDVLDEDGEPVYSEWGAAPSNAVNLVSDGAVPAIFDVDDATRERMSAALEAGRAVVLGSSPRQDDTVTVQTVRFADGAEQPDLTELTWPAEHVQVSEPQPVQLLLPPALVEETGQPATTVGLFFDDGDISPAAEQDLDELLGGIDENASIYVERGYQAPDENVIVLLVLFGLGAVLMLGGTLTATFLALSDARPDLATLAAVGAAPRARRGVAASYALVVGFVGAVLGAVVGFIPGVAITFPLTTMGAGSCVSTNNGPLVCDAGGPYIDVPWLLILGLVLALPLLTAVIVGLTARSRLPLATCGLSPVLRVLLAAVRIPRVTTGSERSRGLQHSRR